MWRFLTLAILALSTLPRLVLAAGPAEPKPSLQGLPPQLWELWEGEDRCGQLTLEQWAGSLALDHRVAAMVAPAAKVIPYRFILEDLAEAAKPNRVQFGPAHAARVSRNTPSGASGIGFGFTGHEYDSETGLYYMKGRYYDPRTARFLTQDPATPDYTNPPSLHRYLYAYGNPTVYVDPDGRVAETVWDVISLSIGLGSLGYNLSEGNYRDAGIDALGVTADSIAALVPFLPGGAGAAIKAARVGTATVQQVNRARKVQRSVDALQAIDQGINAIQSASAAKENLEQGDLGWAVVNTTLGALGARGAASNTGAVAGNRYFDDVPNPRGPPPPSQVTVNVENPNGLGTVSVPQRSPGGTAPSVDADSPYDPQSVFNELERRYPDQVTSTTIPRENLSNVRLAGQRHPTTGIVFDRRGFPVFDDVLAFDTRIGREVAGVRRRGAHFTAATESLQGALARGEVDPGRFTGEQLRAIEDGAEKIPGFTWHHHQDLGRLQLVPEDIHKTTGHVGGISVWFQ